MEYKKDQFGNDITSEEYVDPRTGKKVKVEKRVVKDREGNVILYFIYIKNIYYKNKTI